jgi:hypothetical protein
MLALGCVMLWGAVVMAQDRDPPPLISVQQYQAIRVWMSYDEVVQILGRPGREHGASGQATHVLWMEESDAVIGVSFVKGRVVAKTQRGLP